MEDQELKTEKSHEIEYTKENISEFRASLPGTDPFSFTINETTGSINCMFCYGSCGSSWRNEDIRKFILSCDDGYISSNFFGSKGRYFYFEESKQNLLKEILRTRKKGHIFEEQAAEAWHYIKHELDSGNGSNYMWYIQQMCECPHVEEIFGEETVRGFCTDVWGLYPNDKFFMNRIWPNIRKIIETEVSK